MKTKANLKPLVGDFVSRVFTERLAQDEQWGGPFHDDGHVREDWQRYIRHQLNKSSPISRRQLTDEEFEHVLVKIAALAQAAFESSKRKRRKLDDHTP